MAETGVSCITKVEPENEICDEDYQCEQYSQECKDLFKSLPREKGWAFPYIYLYQDIWYTPVYIQGIRSFQKHFKAKDNDIVIATLPKSGTTWLKALIFAIVSRKHFSPSQTNHPLLTHNAHELVPFIALNYCANNQIPDLSNMPEPRLFGTHVPFHSLPDSITKSKCKLIYICRNPFDHFVSLWLFMKKISPPSFSKISCEEAFEKYCNGINEVGPFWTHMLGYWKESKETLNKVLFLKYEDLKGDIKLYLQRAAEFLECPFTSEEKSNGVIQSIIELCSFEKMKELEVNKIGKFLKHYENRDLFRKGEVGDWVNHFSPWMVEKLSKVIEEKLTGSGLSF
ncbi:cytosolic sulfotransferase 15-like [Prosopis cineraria]|uniref:cytosolic sulfotransferase 15-like n=1 Tax=Prosopis cineraria TaxID=364024 RepID=UPI0024104B34|nr:cytosolic sulfotransferase 15-like [Prosopis cineraria]